MIAFLFFHYKIDKNVNLSKRLEGEVTQTEINKALENEKSPEKKRAFSKALKNACNRLKDK